MLFNPSAVSKKDAYHFIDYLVDTLSIGLSIQDCVNKYKPRRKKLEIKFKLLSTNLKKGISFSQSLRKLAIFDEQVISVVESGELSGKLTDVCRELRSRFLDDIKFNAELVRSLTMPAIELIAAAIVTVYSLVFVVPSVSETLMKVGDLPEFSKKTFSFAIYFRAHIMEIALGIVAILGVVYYSVRGKVVYYLYSFPLIGTMLKYAYSSRFFYQLEVMLKGGVALTAAIKKIRATAKNNYEKAALSMLLVNMQKGMHFDEAVEKSKKVLFPEEVLNMLGVARLTGDYKTVSEKLVYSMREKTKETADRIARLTEPVVILFLGALVFLIVMSVYYPIVALSSK